MEIVAPLLIGFTIYILYRSENIFLNAYLTDLGFAEIIKHLKSISPGDLSYGLKFSLPNALWLSSLQLLILRIWNLSRKKNIQIISAAAIIMIITELLQKFRIIDGTFCLIDILYIIGTSLLVSQITINRNLSHNTSYDLVQKIILTITAIISYGSFAMWTGDV